MSSCSVCAAVYLITQCGDVWLQTSIVGPQSVSFLWTFLCCFLPSVKRIVMNVWNIRLYKNVDNKYSCLYIHFLPVTRSQPPNPPRHPFSILSLLSLPQPRRASSQIDGNGRLNAVTWPWWQPHTHRRRYSWCSSTGTDPTVGPTVPPLPGTTGDIYRPVNPPDPSLCYTHTPTPHRHVYRWHQRQHSLQPFCDRSRQEWRRMERRNCLWHADFKYI